MIPERKLQEYQNELDENEKQIRKLVLESYNDIALGKGRDYNDFFDKLESRYSNEKI
jgi:DNA-binding MurR/RpiR family transcriptional regulator